MFSTIKLWIYGTFAAIAMAVGAFLYNAGRKGVKSDIMEDDYEHAEDIRRRVSIDRADRVRKLDDAGWRD